MAGPAHLRSGIEDAASQAHPRLELCGVGTGSARQSAVSRVYPIGAEKVPDAKTVGRLAQALGPEVIEKLHARIVALAQDCGVVRGRRMRVDTTVVETNIHYPTDSSLMGDGVRVLTRLMKKVTEIAGKAGTQLRDRTRSVQRRLIEIGRASRSKGKGGMEKMKAVYRKLVETTSRVMGQAKYSQSRLPRALKAPRRFSIRRSYRASDENCIGFYPRAASNAADQGSPLRWQHAGRR